MTSWTTDPEPPVRQVGPGWTTDPQPPQYPQESPWFTRLTRVGAMTAEGTLSCVVEPFIQGQALLRGDGALTSEMAGRHWRDGAVVSNGVLVGEVWQISVRTAALTGDGLLELGINDGLSAVMCPGYGGKLEGRGDLTFVITGGNRIYPDGLSADVEAVTGLSFRDVPLSSIGYFEAVLAPKTFRGVLLAGDGALTSGAAASYPQDAQLSGDGTLSATMVNAFTPIIDENNSRTNAAVPGPGLTGVWVTLIGGGGSGGNGFASASAVNRYGGGGAGGGGKIDRFYIDAASLPSGVYTVTRGLGATSAQGGGGASRFTCGTIVLTANGGAGGTNGSTSAGGAGAGGTATQSGITGAALRPGGAGTAGVASGTAADAADSALDRAGGGGGGGGYSSGNVLGNGGDGGASATAAGGTGALGGNTVGGHGGNALPGFAGGGGGGAGGRASGANAPNDAGDYGGGGGGGGGCGSTVAGPSGDGANGYTLIEWV